MSILENQQEKKKNHLKALFFGILDSGFLISLFVGIGIGLHEAIQIMQYGLVYGAVIIFLRTVTNIVLTGCAISGALCLIIAIYLAICRFIQAATYIRQIINEKTKYLSNVILAIIIAISIAGAIVGVNKLLRNYNNNDSFDLKTNTTTYICGDISSLRDKLG